MFIYLFIYCVYIHQGYLQDVNICMFSFPGTSLIDFIALTW